MVELGILHYLYIFMVLIVLVTMACKKDIVVPCIIGLFVMGFASSGSLIKGIQVIYNSLIAAGTQFWEIIVIISLVVAMTKALQDIGADHLIMSPVKKMMANRTIAFWVLGIFMALVSGFIWPSPAVALIGAIMLPAAIKAGLPALWAAVVMNLFGHGLALSGDYFIQGAPAITAKAAGIDDTFKVVSASFPLWIVMSVVTITVAFFMMKRELKNADKITLEPVEDVSPKEKPSIGSYVVAVITPAAFIIDIFIMYIYQLKGGDATALIGGTAMLIMVLASIIKHKFVVCLEKVTDHVKDGFIFGIKIFAPVVVIGAFFFLGSESTAKQILGENATGFLNDIGIYLSNNVPMSKIPVILVQALVGIITGLDGSGFSGLPLVGSLAMTFSTAIDISKEGLAALGQIVTVWVGGGTIIPWAVIPVAAICNVSPIELARKNMIPVLCGFVAMIITAIFIL